MIFNDIFQAARRADFDQFKRLLDAADLTATTNGNKNLLHMAIAYRRPDNAAELIKRGVDVNAQDKNGESPLHYAATSFQAEIARLILENGGDPTITDKHGNSPLWNAVFNAKGKYDIVILLLQKGASAAQKNKHGFSPLDFAKQIEDKRMINLLIQGRE